MLLTVCFYMLSIEDVTQAACPPNKPYKCLPYGSCFGHESYCDPITRAVESCFPHNLHEDERLPWCRQVYKNETVLPNQACRFACNVEFSHSELDPGYGSCPSSGTIIILTIACSVLATIFIGCLLFLFCRHLTKRMKFTGKRSKNKSKTDVNVTMERNRSNILRIQEDAEQDEPAADNSADLATGDSSRHERENRDNLALLDRADLNVTLRSDYETVNVMGSERISQTSSNSNGSRGSNMMPSVTTSPLSRDDSGFASERDRLLDDIGNTQQLEHVRVSTAQEPEGETPCMHIQSDVQRTQGFRCIINPTSPDEGANRLVTNISLYNPE